MKHLSWSSGMNTLSEKCFYLVWIHFYLMELKQKACILKLWSVKMKDLWVCKSTVKMKWMEIKSRGIKRVSVGFVRCGGRNTREQFKSSYIHCEAVRDLLRAVRGVYLYLVTCMECLPHETYCKPSSFLKSWRIKVSRYFFL